MNDEDFDPTFDPEKSSAYCKYCYTTHDRWYISGDHPAYVWECLLCNHFTADEFMNVQGATDGL